MIFEPDHAANHTKPKTRRDEDEPEGDDESLDVDLSNSDITIETEESGSDRPKTGEHPAISIHAGPLPIARK